MARRTVAERFSQCLQALLDQGLAWHGRNAAAELLSAHEGMVLALVGAREPVSMSDLAAAAGARPNTMTGIVDRLVRRGFLARRRGARDRRTVMVGLTELGREFSAKHREFIEEYGGGLLQRLDPSERETLTRLLEQLVVPATAGK
jgi:DNA-binding MarR family transcriptional regulator